jgi:hypothetical protein
VLGASLWVWSFVGWLALTPSIVVVLGLIDVLMWASRKAGGSRTNDQDEVTA